MVSVLPLIDGVEPAEVQPASTSTAAQADTPSARRRASRRLPMSRRAQLRRPGRYGSTLRIAMASRTIAIPIRIESNPLKAAIAHRMIQMQRPAVAVRMRPMVAGMLTERGGEAPQQLGHGGGGILRLAGGANQAAADDHAVGAGRGGLARLLGKADAEPDRHRNARVRAGPCHRGPQLVGVACAALARGPGQTPCR